MKKKFILFFLLTQTQLFAYPIIAYPLPNLIDGSDYIITGEVLGVIKNDIKSEAVASILVKSYIKGGALKDTLSVYFSLTQGCPTNPKYREGTSILAFLKSSKEGLYTYGYSHGVRILDEIGIKDYDDLIRDYMNDCSIADSLSRRKKRIEWTISCLVKPTTKCEGIIILTPDFFHVYPLQYRIQLTDLDSNQIEVIKNIVLTSDKLDLNDLALLRFIVPEDCNFLHNWCSSKFASALDDNNEDPDTYFARRLILEVSKCFSENEVFDVLGDRFFEEDIKNKTNLQKMSQIASEFLLELQKVCY